MLDKLKDRLWDIVSFIIGALGVAATLISAWITDENGLGYIFFFVVATESVLVGIGIWNLKIKYLYKKHEKELQDEIVQAKNDLTQLNEAIIKSKADKESEDDLKNKYLAIIITNIKNASKLNNDLCNRIPEITEKAYHLLETLQANGTINEETIRSEILKSYDDFSIGLFDLFKRYSSHLLNYAVSILEAYLKIKGYSHRVSVTIKLFNKPLYSNMNTEDVLVYTAFRDKITYDEHEREIGEVSYTISGNADFVQCLRKDHFVINNASKDSESYYNEHKDFDSYYNCAIVVALRVKQADNSFKFLGYLCCDTLNRDSSREIFDKEMAQLLFSLAQLYATFMETLNSNWIDRVQGNANVAQSFLELICNKTYHGKK